MTDMIGLLTSRRDSIDNERLRAVDADLKTDPLADAIRIDQLEDE